MFIKNIISGMADTVFLLSSGQTQSLTLVNPRFFGYTSRLH